MHPLVRLAKEAVEMYVLEEQTISPPDELTPEMRERAGVFVSIKKRGQLRGCIGTYLPSMDNVASEVIQNAISAATRDPRFLPVEPSELNELEYSVDVLTRPEKVNSLDQLDPKRYGIIIASGNRRGLLLPDLEGINTVEDQIGIASMKAGISPDEEKEIYRFEVKRYK
jgi:AmmeMemoRadiSam system protein A